MSTQLTYPGVYIEELPSGEHTIAGVATSVTAFIGRAPIGPTDDTRTIFNFGDFHRMYGGLSHDYPMSYAVYDFFLNGGSQAVIARLVDRASKASVLISEPPPGLPTACRVLSVHSTTASGTVTNTLTLADCVKGLKDGDSILQAGDTFQVKGSPVTYTVTKFPGGTATAPDKSQLEFTPPPPAGACWFCNEVDFAFGAPATGWTVSAAATSGDASLTITGGQGVPRIGQYFVVIPVSPPRTAPDDTDQRYVVTEVDSANGAFTISFGPAATVDIAKGSAVYFSPPTPAPPAGWKLAGPVGASTSSFTIKAGSGVPFAGQYVSFDDKPTAKYQVTAVTAAKLTGSISAATAADPIVLTSKAHGMSAGSTPSVTISGGTGAWTAVNGTFPATPIDADTFSIPVDGASLGTLAGTLTFKLACGEECAITINNAITGIDACTGVTLGEGPVTEKGWEISADATDENLFEISAANPDGSIPKVDQRFTIDGVTDDNGALIEFTVLMFVSSAPTAPASIGAGTLVFTPQVPKTKATAGTAIYFQPLLKIEAADEGVWGNRLTVTIDRNGLQNNQQQPTKQAQSIAKGYEQFGINAADLFNIEVVYSPIKGAAVRERFNAVCTTPGTKSPNRLDRVLANQSNLIRVALDHEGKPMLPPEPPGNMQTPYLAGGTDGSYLTPLDYLGDESLKTGMYMLDKVDIFNLLCITPDNRTAGLRDVDPSVLTAAAEYCVKRRAMLLVDPPESWHDKALQGELSEIDPSTLGIEGDNERNAAVYFPRIIKEDLEMKGQLDTFVACGMLAGIFAATDATRGVWKAPAGIDAALNGINSLQTKLTDDENGQLNPLGINCLRTFPVIGSVVWGARTLRGADILEDDYKYIPVRRLTLYIEESLYRGTQWAVFEPNDEALWSQLRLSVGGFLSDLSRQGALYDYQVVCDATTTTPRDIELGIVNILVRIAPVRPAEFIVIKIQQQAPAAKS